MDEENNSIYIFTVYFSSGKTLSAKFNGKKKNEILNSFKKGWNETTSIFFTVDSNGFVSLNGSAVGETITGNTGGALSPTAGEEFGINFSLVTHYELKLTYKG